LISSAEIQVEGNDFVVSPFDVVTGIPMRNANMNIIEGNDSWQSGTNKTAK